MVMAGASVRASTLALLASAAVANAKPVYGHGVQDIHVDARGDGCHGDNLLRSFRNKKVVDQGVAFCQAYNSVTTVTTVTIQTNYNDLQTASALPTQYPAFLTPPYVPAKLSSACSCLSVPPLTVTASQYVATTTSSSTSTTVTPTSTSTSDDGSTSTTSTSSDGSSTTSTDDSGATSTTSTSSDDSATTSSTSTDDLGTTSSTSTDDLGTTSTTTTDDSAATSTTTTDDSGATSTTTTDDSGATSTTTTDDSGATSTTTTDDSGATSTTTTDDSGASSTTTTDDSGATSTTTTDDSGATSTSTDSSTSTTTTAPASTATGTFLGCYYEPASQQKALPSRRYTSGPDQKMTIELCATFCAGSALYGLEYGSECYCGNSIASGTFRTRDSACTFACEGNSAEICGDANRLSLYQLSAPDSEVPTTTTLAPGANPYTATFGCVANPTGGAQALPDARYQDSQMTQEECFYNCKQGGFGWAGLEYGDECWCANGLANGAGSVDEDSCDLKCAGDASENCGGQNYVYVFKQ